MWKSIVAPVAGIFTAKVERKKARDMVKGKIALAKQTGANEITLVDGEWEALKAKSEDSSWKDEYVTILVTAPIAMIIIGCIMISFTGDARLLEGAVAGINALQAADVPMGTLMTATVYAALSLKLWRSS